jgi:hypothetical protein
MRIMTLAAATLTVTLMAGSAGAQEGTPAMLSGAVKAPMTLDMKTLGALKPVEIDISFKTDKGDESAHYKGVLLYDVLQQAGLVNAEGKNAQLRHTIMVTGRDGYAMALAEGEIDPNFEHKQVIIAFDGGKPPADYNHLRVLVPGDLHGGRAIKDVATIVVQ